jgi:tetratricopeptide (TPR) repeat protein
MLGQASAAEEATCPGEDALADFLAGDASDSDRELIERHIDRCDRCASTLALFGDAFMSSAGRPVVAADTPQAIRRNGFAGRYEIQECVGFGSGGTVYKAYDPELDRIVALKVLQSSDGGSTRPEQHWTREAKVMAKVVHPNVVAVHDVGMADACVFIAAEFVEGGSLDQWLSDKPRTWPQILRVFRDAGAGLAAIHERGLVHRDFKPHNVMVGTDGRARVTDFGLARILPEFGESEDEVTGELQLSAAQLAATIASRTQTGTIVGTPSYMSPEQWRGRVADDRSDQFSFCVALYEALYGRRPFDGRTAVELAEQVCDGRPQPIPAKTKVPRWLGNVVMRGLSHRPEDRYESMPVLLGALTDTPGRVRRRWTVAAVAVGFVGVGLGSYSLAGLEDKPCADEVRRVEAVWDTEAQAAVADALAAVPAIARDVDQSIAAWSERWTQTSVAACEAAKVTESTSERQYALQMACLDRRLSELRAAAGVVAGLDVASATKALDVLETLGAPERCDDLTQLETLEPTYASPDGRALSHQLAVDIDRVEALRMAGKLDAAAELAREVVAQADESGDPAVRAEALVSLGQTLTSAKQPTEAEQVLRDGVWAAEASGHVEMATAGWIELVQVIGAQQERYDAGEDAAERAAAAVHRLGDPEQAIALASNRAVVASVRGDYEEALRMHREVFQQAVELLGPDDRQVARMHVNLAAVLTHLGRIDEAVEHAEAGLAIQRARFPGAHPVSVEMLNTLGAMRVYQGDLKAARETLEQAVAEAEQTLPPVSASLASVLSNLAQVDIMEEHPEAARERYTRVLAIYRAVYGAEHPDVAMALHNLASAIDAAGDKTEAVRIYRESLAMRLKLMGAEHPATAGSMHNLGLVLAFHGDIDEGIELMEGALAVRLKVDVDPYLRATTSFMLARAYDKRGDHDDALRSAKAAAGFLREIAPRKADVLTHIEAWITKHESAAPSK